MVPPPKTDIDALILFEQRVNLVNGPVILLQLARILVPLHLSDGYPVSFQGGDILWWLARCCCFICPSWVSSFNEGRFVMQRTQVTTRSQAQT